MPKMPKRIKLGNDVALIVRDAEAEGTPVEIDANGKTYDLVPHIASKPEGDIWADYDPQRVLAALQAARGAFSGLDTKQLLADIHAQRGQDSQGRPAER